MKKDIKLIFEDGSEMDVFRGTTVRDILKEINDGNLIALRVNGSAVPADYEIMEDAYIDYITTNDRIGHKIYTNGLKYVFIFLAIGGQYLVVAPLLFKYSP